VLLRSSQELISSSILLSFTGKENSLRLVSILQLNLEKEYEEVGAEGGDDEDDKGEEY